jgi:hypothetical protein
MKNIIVRDDFIHDAIAWNLEEEESEEKAIVLCAGPASKGKPIRIVFRIYEDGLIEFNKDNLERLGFTIKEVGK